MYVVESFPISLHAAFNSALACKQLAYFFIIDARAIHQHQCMCVSFAIWYKPSFTHDMQ